MDKSLEEQLDELIDSYVEEIYITKSTITTNDLNALLSTFALKYYLLIERFEEDDN